MNWPDEEIEKNFVVNRWKKIVLYFWDKREKNSKDFDGQKVSVTYRYAVYL